MVNFKRWKYNYTALVDFCKKFGRLPNKKECICPETGTDCYKWFLSQRRLYRDCNMSKECIDCMVSFFGKDWNSCSLKGIKFNSPLTNELAESWLPQAYRDITGEPVNTNTLPDFSRFVEYYKSGEMELVCTPADWNIFITKYGNGISAVDVARLCDRSEYNVQIHLSRARRNIREAFKLYKSDIVSIYSLFRFKEIKIYNALIRNGYLELSDLKPMLEGANSVQEVLDNIKRLNLRTVGNHYNSVLAKELWKARRYILCS